MIKVPEVFTGEENFWEWNSQYKIVYENTDLYKKDKTKSKVKSSKVMWGIFFLLHPTRSIMYNIPGKEELIIENYIKDNKFKWDSVEDEQQLFLSSILTQAERSLVNWDEYMKKRDKYLKEQEYYFDQYDTDEYGNNILSKTGQPVLVRGTAKQLDDAYKVTPNMYADYDKIRKQLRNEELKKGRKSKPKSPSETGEI